MAQKLNSGDAFPRITLSLTDGGTLEALGAKIVAASADPLDKAREVAASLSYPVGYGVTHDMADRIGAWWEARRGIVQPSEFIVDASGKVRSSTYSSGPIGRIDPGDVVKLIQFYEKAKP